MQLRNPQPNAYLLISGLFAELQGKSDQIGKIKRDRVLWGHPILF